MVQRYRDRAQAGQELVKRLSGYAGRPDVLVLGLPRGGIPVAYQVARGLGAPLDVFVVRKLGVPGEEELAMGAIAANGVRVINEDVVRSLGLTREAVDAVAAREQVELERREREYRGDKPPIDARGRIVILVDDGLATGATMRAAARAVRSQSPARLIIAVPVAAAETCEALQPEADDVICALAPEAFYAVGLWYDDFSQTTDREVQELLQMAAKP